MPYQPLTPQGIIFITNTINTNSSKVMTNTNLTYSTQQYVNNVINWITGYSSTYNVDSNIIAAQINDESTYRSGVDSHDSSGNIIAMGLTQFTLPTVNTIIFASNVFTQVEENAISKGITLIKNQVQKVDTPTLAINLHNNPQIMIKAQCYYMSYIASKINSRLASVCLYGYNRGPAKIQETYGNTILQYIKINDNGRSLDSEVDPNRIAPTEGTDYVRKIFQSLNQNFGYNLDNTIDYATRGFGQS